MTRLWNGEFLPEFSFFFMFLVGMSMPHFIGVNFAETHSGAYSVTGSQEMMSWG